MPTLIDYLQRNKLNTLFPAPQLQQGNSNAAVFNPDAPEEDAPYSSPQVAQQQSDINPAQRLRELYQPQTQSSDRLNNMLNNAPVRPEISRMRNFMGNLAGFASSLSPATYHNGQPIGVSVDPKIGAAVENNVKYGDFNEKLNDYANGLVPAEKAAQIENTSNTNSRQLAEQQIGHEIASDKNAKSAAAAQLKLAEGEKEFNAKLTEATRRHDDLKKEADDRINFLQNQLSVRDENQKARIDALKEYHDSVNELNKLKLDLLTIKNEADINDRNRKLDQKDQEIAQVGERLKQSAQRITDLEKSTEDKNKPTTKVEKTKTEGGINIPLLGNVGGHKVKTTTTSKLSVPPIEQRTVGQVVTFANGKKGKWNGRAWDEVQ